MKKSCGTNIALPAIFAWLCVYLRVCVCVCVYAARKQTKKKHQSDWVPIPMISSLTIKPENCLQHKVGQSQAIDDLLPLHPLVIVDLDIENASIKFGQLPAQIQYLLVGRQLAHGRAITVGQHRSIEIVVLLLQQLRALARAARGELREGIKREIFD